jgi:hypothetical protein
MGRRKRWVAAGEVGGRRGTGRGVGGSWGQTSKKAGISPDSVGYGSKALARLV